MSIYLLSPSVFLSVFLSSCFSASVYLLISLSLPLLLHTNDFQVSLTHSCYSPLPLSLFISLLPSSFTPPWQKQTFSCFSKISLLSSPVSTTQKLKYREKRPLWTEKQGKSCYRHPSLFYQPICMFICLCYCLSVCQTGCLYVFLCVIFVCMSVYPFVHLSVRPSFCLSVCQSVHPSVHPVCLSDCL